MLSGWQSIILTLQNFKNEIENYITSCANPTNVHTANKILTNAILTADRHNIPKGKIKENKQPLPEEILKLIRKRDETRKKNSKDPVIKDLNDNITNQIQKHKAKIWENKINQNWDHKNNTHIFWNTLHTPKHIIKTR